MLTFQKYNFYLVWFNLLGIVDRSLKVRKSKVVHKSEFMTFNSDFVFYSKIKL